MLTDRQRRELYSRWEREKREEMQDWLLAIAIGLYFLWMVLA